MSDLRIAAQQALEALEYYQHRKLEWDYSDEAAITALRAVLAQKAEPAQEPVAWNWMLDGLPYGRACYGDPPDADIAERAATAGRTVRLLYTAPPQRKPLTGKEKRALADKFLSCQPESYEVSGVFDLISAVERAHGIT